MLKLFSLSDHILLLMDFKLKPARKEMLKLCRNLSLWKGDYVGLRINLRLDLFACNCFSNCNQMLSEWHHCLYEAITIFTPTRTSNQASSSVSDFRSFLLTNSEEMAQIQNYQIHYLANLQMNATYQQTDNRYHYWLVDT